MTPSPCSITMPSPLQPNQTRRALILANNQTPKRNSIINLTVMKLKICGFHSAVACLLVFAIIGWKLKVIFETNDSICAAHTRELSVWNLSHGNCFCFHFEFLLTFWKWNFSPLFFPAGWIWSKSHLHLLLADQLDDVALTWAMISKYCAFLRADIKLKLRINGPFRSETNWLH